MVIYQCAREKGNNQAFQIGMKSELALAFISRGPKYHPIFQLNGSCDSQKISAVLVHSVQFRTFV